MIGRRIIVPNKECYWKNPELYRQKSREYNKNNKDKVRESSKNWAAKNTDKTKSIKTRYYEKNKHKVMQRTYQRRQECKKRAVEYLGGKCNRCNLVDKCLDVYCFHHKDPSTKSFKISSRRMKFETIRDELDKCLLLCVNCHRKEHCKYKTGNDRYTRYRRNRKIKASAMFDNKCSDCNLAYELCVYDFHHPDFSQKDLNFSDNKSWAITEKELKKCVMLCANCHKRRHANRPLQRFIECDAG